MSLLLVLVDVHVHVWPRDEMNGVCTPFVPRLFLFVVTFDGDGESMVGAN